MNRFSRVAAASLVAVIAAGCGEAAPTPTERERSVPQWEQRGFDSELECARAHGYSDGLSISEVRGLRLEFWCG